MFEPKTKASNMQKLRHCVLAKVGALGYDWGHHATYLTSFFICKRQFWLATAVSIKMLQTQNFREDLQAP